jgi:glycosyltransferase involved in cell wall biosynthesis
MIINGKKQQMSKVTVITATTGSNYLTKNILSVQAQTYTDIQHLVVVDGQEHVVKVTEQLKLLNQPNIDLLVLPYPTGTEQYNGHRIYGASTYLAKGDYVCFLDEDNWIDTDHVKSLMNTIKDGGWACSLRKIVDSDGKFICNDDCESLGNWRSVLNDYFVDVNCFFLPKPLALELSPIWYRRARHPDDQPEVDRALTSTLKDNKIDCNVTGTYTVNYRAGNRADSVQGQFFKQGNEIMKQQYNGDFPWRK